LNAAINFRTALLSGFIGILVTNFFGFSIVPTTLLFFLFPAFSYSLNFEDGKENKSPKISLSIYQKTTILFVLCAMFFGLWHIAKYWLADYYYQKGANASDKGQMLEAASYFLKALHFSPREPVFWSDMAKSTANLAISKFNNKETDLAAKTGVESLNQAQKAIIMSPNNINLRRNIAGIEVKLAEINPEYMLLARKTLYDSIDLAPTDPKLLYNLALVELRLGNLEKSDDILETAIQLKANYKEARYARALILMDLKKSSEAQEELQYIVAKIDPNDQKVIKQLNEINSTKFP
jgi:tetratricopeptide (TPR) repeat protein